ncbi:alkaline phosphatase D family protein [Aquihabitans sp. McL0605]|uniref:alkaline phosphatase D family protein n=1 Tax=Aquihabitans sp. McL0605 TaxID=3415671 RepID=UPI003CEC0F8B
MTSGDELRQDLSNRVLLHRRKFLGLMAAGAGAAVLGACSSSGGSEGAKATTTTGARTTTSLGKPMPPPEAKGIDSDPFLLGVASGDPLATSVILWTRLATDLVDPTGLGGLGDADHAVLWEVAGDKAFTELVASGTEPAGAEFGHSVHVEADGLQPDTWYWYRFRIGTYTSPVGKTRTTPADDAEVDQLRFAFASCQLRTAGHWTSYPHLVADEPDLVFFLGDYIYEYPGGTGDLENPLPAEPQTLADYRVLYAYYQGDQRIQDAHAVAPWVITWDDHEVENNYAAGVPEKAADQPTFPARHKAAYQAFWEAHPMRIDPPAKDGSLLVYRDFQYGKLARFFVLDGRQHRSDQACDDKIGINADDCPELGDADRTMLGTEQEQWLSTGLKHGGATWTVLPQQTVVKALVLGSIVLNVDQWDGYPAARTRLLESIQDAGIENVVVLTGDIHAGGAADLRLPDAGVTGAIVAHEFVGPAISSPGFGAIASGLDLSAFGLAYANFEDHGYVRCTVTPERWTTEFLVVDTIDAPTSAIKVDATVEVLAGTPGMKRI